MRTWLTRHRWAFPVIAVTIALIGATVIYPMWWRNIGYLQATENVGAGDSVDIDGVRWRLAPLPPPDFVDADTAPGTRPVLYVLTHEVDGRSSTVPDRYAKCEVAFVDDAGRRWLPQALPFGSYPWLEAEGLTADCRKPLPLVAYAQVPADAEISAVELLLSKFADENLRVAPDVSELTTVVRFDTR
jgi:hypothetical protein